MSAVGVFSLPQITSPTARRRRRSHPTRVEPYWWRRPMSMGVEPHIGPRRLGHGTRVSRLEYRLHRGVAARLPTRVDKLRHAPCLPAGMDQIPNSIPDDKPFIIHHPPQSQCGRYGGLPLTLDGGLASSSKNRRLNHADRTPAGSTRSTSS